MRTTPRSRPRREVRVLEDGMNQPRQPSARPLMSYKTRAARPWKVSCKKSVYAPMKCNDKEAGADKGRALPFSRSGGPGADHTSRLMISSILTGAPRAPGAAARKGSAVAPQAEHDTPGTLPAQLGNPPTCAQHVTDSVTSQHLNRDLPVHPCHLVLLANGPGDEVSLGEVHREPRLLWANLEFR